MRKCRILHDYTEQYFKKHPEEIDAFLKESFEEYAKDGDSRTLLSQLRVVARANRRDPARTTKSSLRKRESPLEQYHFHSRGNGLSFDAATYGCLCSVKTTYGQLGI